MTADRDDERYQDILKKIAEGRTFGSRRRELLPQTPHDRALDRINAFDSLAPLALAESTGARSATVPSRCAARLGRRRSSGFTTRVTTATRPCICWVSGRITTKSESC